MTEDHGKRIILIIGVGVLVVAVLFGYFNNKNDGYYQTKSGEKYYTGTGQSPEGETFGYYTILNNSQLLDKIGLDEFQSVRAQVEEYVNTLPDKPKALFYINNSFQLMSGGRASFKIDSVLPKYQFMIVFDVTNGHNGVSIE